MEITSRNENAMRNEKIVNVPLPPDVKERLAQLADLHGRATIREAAVVLIDYVRRQDGELTEGEAAK